jgi:hypothetical protein
VRAYAAERYGGLAPDPAPVFDAWSALRPWMALLWLEKAPAQAGRQLAALLRSAGDPKP